MNSETPLRRLADSPDTSLSAALWAGRKVIFALAALCSALAAAVSFVLPEEWEASGVVRIAHVGEAKPTAFSPSGVEGSWVEPLARSAERLRLRSFQDSVLVALGKEPDGETGEANLYRASFRARVLPGADAIRVDVRSRTPQGASKLLELVVATLARIHEAQLAPGLERLRRNLADTERQIVRLDSEKAILYDSLGRAGADKSQVAAVMFALAAERVELVKQRLSLEAQLGPDNFSPTSLISPVTVSERPVFPRRGLLTATGLLVGLVLGAVWTLLRRAPTRPRQTALP